MFRLIEYGDQVLNQKPDPSVAVTADLGASARELRVTDQTSPDLE